MDPRRATGGGLGFPGPERSGIARLLECPCVPRSKSRGFALSSRPVIAVDLGGTRIRAAVVLPDGTRLARNDARPRTMADRRRSSRPASTRRAERAPRRRRTIAREHRRHRPVLAWPGRPARGRRAGAAQPGPAFPRHPARRCARRKPNGLPAFLDRDTNVAALGERAFGAARDCDDFIYLTDLHRRGRRDRDRRLAVPRT